MAYPGGQSFDPHGYTLTRSIRSAIRYNRRHVVPSPRLYLLCRYTSSDRLKRFPFSHQVSRSSRRILSTMAVRLYDATPSSMERIRRYTSRYEPPWHYPSTLWLSMVAVVCHMGWIHRPTDPGAAHLVNLTCNPATVGFSLDYSRVTYHIHRQLHPMANH